MNRRAWIDSAGGVIPALGVSLGWFCCLPLLGGALGATVAGVGANLMPLRPWFMTTAVLFLAYGFYRAYRPVEAPCASDGACAAPVSRRGQRILIWITTVVTVALLTVPSWASWLIYWSL